MCARERSAQRRRSSTSNASAQNASTRNSSTQNGFGRDDHAQPLLGQEAPETQPYGKLIDLPIGLDQDVREESVEQLNQILADTMTLRDLYKKHHWQVSGHTFYQLHLLFDKHFSEQLELVDLTAERIQSLGGISVAMPHDIVELTQIPRPPRGREEVPAQLSRLLAAHEIVLRGTRQAARSATDRGDDGTNDLLVSDIIRTNELQVWFVAEHLVNCPTVQVAESATAQRSRSAR